MSEIGEKVRLHLQKGDVTVEVEGTQEYAEERFEELCREHLDGETNESQGSDSTGPGSQETEKELSLTEIYQDSESSTKRENMLVIGWFLEKFRGQTKFTKEELEDKSNSSKVPLGKNLTRDVKKEIKNGNLKEAGKKDGSDAFQLTLSGEDYVKEEIGAPLP